MTAAPTVPRAPTLRALRDYQAAAFDAVHLGDPAEKAAGTWEEKRRRAIVLPTGCGKGMPHDVVMPTPTQGLRRFGDLAVGDQVVGAAGQPTAVTGVYERGVLDVHRVRFSDGTSIIVDGDHLWQVQRRKRQPIVRATRDLATDNLRDDGGWRWSIPMTGPVQHPTAALPVPPYTLGALIANGHTAGRGAPMLTTPDRDVVTLIEGEHVEIVERTVVGYCPRFALPGQQHPIRALGLDVLSGAKFIPRPYLDADVDQRVALLRGLLDGDGSSRAGGRRSVTYSTTSTQLADDLRELIWSLGGTAGLSTADRGERGIEHAVMILPPTWLHPFGTARRRQVEQPRRTFTPRRAIVAVEPAGRMPIRCIRVDAPDSLYLAGREHLVTHNTDVIGAVAVHEARQGRSVLNLAHRSVLLDQITERVRQHDPSIPHGRIDGDGHRDGYPIVEAMTSTLGSKRGEARRNRTGLRRRDGRPAFDTVIYDECHHAAAPGNRMILDWLKCFEDDGARLLGVTATLTRADKYGLGRTFVDVPFRRDIGWAIDSGWLVEPYGKVVVASHVDLDNAKVSRASGDYDNDELGDMVSQDVSQIVDAWLAEAVDAQHPAGRLTAAFTPNVESANQLAAEFAGRGIPTGVITGKTSDRERQVIYRQLSTGVIRVLVGVMVMTEGWDCPEVECVLMARPTKLAGLYTQIVGRGLRPAPWVGKLDCLVLDVVGASRGQQLCALVHLVPGARYDDSPLELAPCNVCHQVGRACLCPSEGAGQPRKPPPKLVGPAMYERLDLVLRESTTRWLATDDGLPFLPAGDRYVVLWERPDGLYRVGHVGPQLRKNDGQRIVNGVTFDQAVAAGERWARTNAGELGDFITGRDNAWRKKPPSPRLIGKARGVGIREPERYRAGELSDRIAVARMNSRLG